MNEEEERELAIEWEASEPEPPEFSIPVVTILGFGALFIFAFAVVATYAVMRNQQVSINPGAGEIPSVLGKADINIIRQAPFLLDTRAYAQKDDDRRRLRAYGWVDPDAGVIHIPVTRAMRLVLAQYPDGGL